MADWIDPPAGWRRAFGRWPNPFGQTIQGMLSLGQAGQCSERFVPELGGAILGHDDTPGAGFAFRAESGFLSGDDRQGVH